MTPKEVAEAMLEATRSARSAAFEEAAKIVRENDANAVDVEKLILQHAKGDGK